MSRRRSTRRRKSVKVLKAISSPLRLQIIDLLLDKGQLSYTEIMNMLRLNPSRDAGRFAYHLKFLLKAGIMEPDAKTKKYRITDLGQMIVNVAEEIEEQVSKRRKLLVRTSRFAIEEFDRVKIVDSLVKEADVPSDLAQKIARETERRLLELKIKYLTAPLIREFVNAILVEKGLEEYRHRLTRLGLPVYDVTQLIKSMGTTSQGVETVHKELNNAVIEEYILLNILPRDVADAHLSGTLHLTDLDSWILKPKELMHDLRFFLREGFKFGRNDILGPTYPPPKSFISALLIASNIVKIAATETSGEQAIDFFNVFLAPFVSGLSKREITDSLRFFIHNLNQSPLKIGTPVETALGLEVAFPSFLQNVDAIGPNGQVVGNYADFIEESHLIASLLLDVMSEEGVQKPVFNPNLIIKIRPEALKNKEEETLLFQAHKLAVENGTPYFADLTPKKQEYASYTSTGCRFTADWTGDWELDTVRTGAIGNVIINLPRTAYDAEGSLTKFYSLLNERLEMALRSLEIKYRNLKKNARVGLPFITQKDQDPYFRLENASRLVSFAGLNETIKCLSGQYLYENTEALSLAEEIVGDLSNKVKRHAKKPETRASLSMIPNPNAAKRLAELDVERYGWSAVLAQGVKDQPFYTDLVTVPLETTVSWEERLNIENRFHKLTPGSHLSIIQLDESVRDPHELLSTTKHMIKTHPIEFYAYNRNLANCDTCQKTFHGILAKCPSCGSVNMVCFSRMSAKYVPLSQWIPAKRLVLEKRSPFMSI